MPRLQTSPETAAVLRRLAELASEAAPTAVRFFTGNTPVTAAAGEAAAQRLEGRPINPREVAEASAWAAVPLAGIVRAGRPSRHAIKRLAQMGKDVVRYGENLVEAGYRALTRPGKPLAERAMQMVTTRKAVQHAAEDYHGKVFEKSKRLYEKELEELEKVLAEGDYSWLEAMDDSLTRDPVFRGELPVFRADLTRKGGLPGRGTFYTTDYDTAQYYATQQRQAARKYMEQAKDEVTKRRLARRVRAPMQANIERGVAKFKRAFVAPLEFTEPLDLYQAAARAMREGTNPSEGDVLAAMALNRIYGGAFSPEEIVAKANRSPQGPYRVADKEFARALQAAGYDGAVFPGSHYVISLPPPTTPLPKSPAR